MLLIESLELTLFHFGFPLLEYDFSSSGDSICPRQHVGRNHNDFRFWIADFRLFDHRMTLSALARTLGGMVKPICLAVLRLITSSNFVGCSTGRSAGLAPLRILST